MLLYYKHEKKQSIIMNSRTDLFLNITEVQSEEFPLLFFFLKFSCIKAPGNKETCELRIQVLPLPPLAQATLQVVFTDTEPGLY